MTQIFVGKNKLPINEDKGKETRIIIKTGSIP